MLEYGNIYRETVGMLVCDYIRSRNSNERRAEELHKVGGGYSKFSEFLASRSQ